MYMVHVQQDGRGWRCLVWRKAGDARAVLLTTVIEQTPQRAVSRARREVRMARHCGGLS